MFEKIRSWINKDVENENEVKMYSVILRYVLLINVVYSLVGLGYSIAFRLGYSIALFVALLLLSVWFFSGTYYNQTKLATFATVVMFCAHMLVHTILFSGDTGLHQLSYIIIIIFFAINYVEKRWIRICFLLSMILYRSVLYAYSLKKGAVYGTDLDRNHFWMAVHTFFFSFMLAVIVIQCTADFSEMRKKLTGTNSRLRDVAGKDPLTGLPNRRRGMEYINSYLENFKAGEVNAVTLVMSDVDHFKRVNDTYGHDNGDIVLADLANIMGAFMRGRGVAVRWGGEEFLLVFAGSNGDETYSQLAELQKEIAELEYVWNGDTIHISLTFGVAEQDNYSSVDNTIREADEKLYIGKEKGRNIIIF